MKTQKLQDLESPVRRAGRPRRTTPTLDNAAILQAALALLEEKGDAFSMRALAQSLGVDAMAVYHYYAGKEELLLALMAQRFAALDPRQPPFTPRQGPQRRLLALCALYLELVSATPYFVRLMARGLAEQADVAERFTALFEQALDGLELDKNTRLRGRDTLVDFLHGYALAGRPASETQWHASVGLVLAGMAARHTAV
ncbi:MULTISPECIES: TetR/AcrR family transcriptional regulator [unclassified Janthinobacterium]|jgi:AcrR family transcriptional regulator|uniref:TetR/AcrR family transcriptional regulator n=1 Tax=unclassified Janthinobacterium TaxID=2610881 RepID=UPI001E525539|nr:MULTISPECIES: TetR/AcrR family transcriptional regulator [unclassified Janthinobacterium]MCC7642922.1 helix-turn-helix transcriptional regulator [Janthinobacterium sp. EB271-G4-3-1]MCC7692998.1 helix-turn-helix transcriptional regulator [Janthinobacterium sp. EB271-G4-3-2]